MRFPYLGAYPKTPDQALQVRLQVTDFVRQRGVNVRPAPPRDIIKQSGPRGIFIVWALPAGDTSAIAGWRIYRGDENTLLDKIPDRGTRNYLVPTTAGSTPPTTNMFVSAVNALGIESVKVQAQGVASVEAGAPSLPSAPPGYSAGNGSDISNNIGTTTRSTIVNVL